MVEYVRSGINYVMHNRRVAAEKVRGQYFDCGRGGLSANGPYGSDEVLGSSVNQIIPVYTGNDNVAELELDYGIGNPCRFEYVGLLRLSSGYIAERAAACANVSEDHERGMPLAPALADVRACRLLAHGRQAILADGIPCPLIALGQRRLDAYPRRLSADGIVGAMRLFGVTYPVFHLPSISISGRDELSNQTGMRPNSSAHIGIARDRAVLVKVRPF